MRISQPSTQSPEPGPFVGFFCFALKDPHPDLRMVSGTVTLKKHYEAF